MDNEFSGMKKLFTKVFGEELDSASESEFEIVSELDPLRDASVYHTEIKKLYSSFKRIAVPDLFLRWGKLCMLIEAKFFTDPSDDEIEKQVATQMEAVEKVRKYTAYAECVFKYVTLTIRRDNKLQEKHHNLTWDELYKELETVDNLSNDSRYCLSVLRCGIDRAKEEAQRTNGVTFSKYTYSQLIKEIGSFLQKGSIYVGFSGGLVALKKADLRELIDRSHYKVSDVQWTENWITIDQLISRLVELGAFESRKA
jgi:hypothetical protein